MKIRLITAACLALFAQGRHIRPNSRRMGFARMFRGTATMSWRRRSFS